MRVQFLKYVTRTLEALPRNLREITYNNNVNKIHSQLKFINNVVQAFVSQGDTGNDGQLLLKDKPIHLWINKRKKTIKVMKMMDIGLHKIKLKDLWRRMRIITKS